MRITKRTNIAMRLLMFCATHPDRLVTKSEVAVACNISENHLAQVVNKLSQLGFVRTHRGRNGGLMLNRAPQEIVIGDVFRQLEATLPIVECFADADNSCPLVSACRLKDALSRAADAFYAALDDQTLESLTCDNAALIRLLAPVSCGVSCGAAAR